MREYLARLSLPLDRPKTLTALAGAEPLLQAPATPAQRLQYFLWKANRNADAMTAQRLALLACDIGCIMRCTPASRLAGGKLALAPK